MFTKPASEIIKNVFQQYKQKAAIAFSGAEDGILIDMAAKSNQAFRVFFLDTGRLHPETYEYIEKMKQYYNVNIEAVFPNHSRVERLVAQKGLFSFQQDGQQECCTIRKGESLNRHLVTLDAWITGIRRDQADTRTAIHLVEETQTVGADSKMHTLSKFNPLAYWTQKQVWDYIISENVPYNKLHEKGLQSIGCAPCTKAVLPGQHERTGRWSWMQANQKECGIHKK